MSNADNNKLNKQFMEILKLEDNTGTFTFVYNRDFARRLIIPLITTETCASNCS